MVGVGPDGTRSQLARLGCTLDFRAPSYNWHPIMITLRMCMLALCTGMDTSVQAATSTCHPRVCIVNNHGAVLMDKFARPKERVTDFRTRFSGIRCFLLP